MKIRGQVQEKVEVEITNLRPHVTLTLFRSDDPRQLLDEVFDQLEALCENLSKAASKEPGTDLRIHDIGHLTEGGIYARAAWYRIDHAPGWLGAEGEAPQEALGSADGEGAETQAGGDDDETRILTDTQHHLVVLLADNEFTLVYASQDSMRSRLNELIEFGSTGDEDGVVRIAQIGAPLTRLEIEQAFVRGNARSAWLEGLHPSTVLKPDRKILSGPNLRYAFDAAGEQTFTYTAAISELEDDGNAKGNGTGKKPFRVGVSHSKRTLWTRSTKTFPIFIREVQELLRRLRHPPKKDRNESELKQAGLPYLARPLNSLVIKQLEDGFDIGYERPATPEAEMLRGGEAQDQPDFDDPWQVHGTFVVQGGLGQRPGEIVADTYYDDRKIARLSLRPTPHGDQHVEILHEVIDYFVGKDDATVVEMDRSLAKRNSRFTLRYASGHIIQGGVLYSLRFNDSIFERWSWLNLGGYDSTKEKPELPGPKNSKVFNPAGIGDGKDRSLFSYIQLNAATLIAPDPTVPPSKGWLLLCDDGAGEIADFIAFDPKAHFLTFIHVKSAKGSDGSISVVPFSEVVTQAEKNLRDLDDKHLMADLQRRTSAANQDLVWHADGSRSDRTKFIAALKSLGRGAARHVIVFQPRITQATWNKAVANHRADKVNPDVGRMRQLSAVLTSAQSTFRPLGATLSVVGRV